MISACAEFLKIWDEEVPRDLSPAQLEELKDEARRLAFSEEVDQYTSMEHPRPSSPLFRPAACSLKEDGREEKLPDDQNVSAAPPKRARVYVEGMGFKPKSLEVRLACYSCAYTLANFANIGGK